LIDNTNAKDLELYVLMAEHDNAGIPLAYLLLSTAASIEKDKRKSVLASFLSTIRDKYNLIPRFIHTDKDMAEIIAARETWPDAKHQLCRWHLERAVGDRAKLRSLATTKYDAKKANSAYPFISLNFKPRVKSNPRDNEGDDSISDEPPPAGTQPLARPAASQATGPNYIPPMRLPPRPPGAIQPSLTQPVVDEDDDAELVEEEGSNEQRVFCPEPLRRPLVNMMEKHANAHPLIRGDHHPSAEGVREWAVRKAYNFCHENDLPELWAYLWGNWYRWGRWQLWARAPNKEIPRLQRTMFVESQSVFH
jgi:hypothetical protein